jgi:hypothetical protein
MRFCSLCSKNVYNLSALDRTAAQALVERYEGRLCVRFYQRSDGTVLTADCPLGVRRATRRLAVWAAGLVAACFAACVFGVSAVSVSTQKETGKKAMLVRLRQVKVLEPIIEWLDPSPPVVMGVPCPPAPPAPAGPGGGK